MALCIGMDKQRLTLGPLGDGHYSDAARQGSTQHLVSPLCELFCPASPARVRLVEGSGRSESCLSRPGFLALDDKQRGPSRMS